MWAEESKRRDPDTLRGWAAKSRNFAEGRAENESQRGWRGDLRPRSAVWAGGSSPAGFGAEQPAARPAKAGQAQGRPTADPEAKNRSKWAENGPRRHFWAFGGLRRA